MIQYLNSLIIYLFTSSNNNEFNITLELEVGKGNLELQESTGNRVVT